MQNLTIEEITSLIEYLNQIKTKLLEEKRENEIKQEILDQFPGLFNKLKS